MSVKTNQKNVKCIIKNKKGQGMMEYLILTSLIAVASIGVVKVVGNNMARKYENINRALGARTSGSLEAQNAAQSSLNQKDLSNFLEGAR